MPRTVSDLRIQGRSPSELWPVLTGWLGSNGFTILTPQSDGLQQVIHHWDGALLLRPRQGACVALREMTGGGTIVFEASAAQTGNVTTVHLEGYVTGRGPGWKGKEYDLIPKALAVAGVLRKRGLLLMEGLEQTIMNRVALPPVGLPPFGSAGALSDAGPSPRTVCAQCGHSLPPAARFCATCGFPASSQRDAPLLQASSVTSSAAANVSPRVLPTSNDQLGGPSVPLLPGEILVGRYSSSMDGEKRVMTYNMSVMLAIVAGVTVPFLVLSLLTRPPSLLLLFFLYPAVLVGGILAYARHSVSRKGPTTIFVTNRRLIVDQRGKETSSSMTLESVGHVEINVDARAARRAGVAWVYVMPMGTSKPITGWGRSRHVAPGVLWVPAVPLESANALRRLVVSTARQVQLQLGYPAASLAQ